MASLQLDRLPKELIALVATHADASTALSLSTTSKTVRAACYDGFVFRNILKLSQRTRWNSPNLDLDAIAKQIGNSADAWARYAVADQRACALVSSGTLLTNSAWSKVSSWLSELLVAKHPLTDEQQIWDGFCPSKDDAAVNELFSLLLAIMANPDTMPEILQTLASQAPSSLHQYEDLAEIYWDFCLTVLTLRKLLSMRRAAWPYNSSAVIPYIDLPKARDVPLAPLTPQCQMPLPFSGQWDQWHLDHSRELVDSPTFLLDSEWCGYYMHSTRWAFQNGQVDPPMANIRFVKFGGEAHRPADKIQEVHILAQDCQDGIGPFEIDGWLSHTEGACTFSGTKSYACQRLQWDWKLKLTPLGFFGYWGKEANSGFRKHGTLWLWKRSWVN